MKCSVVDNGAIQLSPFRLGSLSRKASGAASSGADKRVGERGGGRPLPNVFQSGFSDSSKSDKKFLGGGGTKFVSGLYCVTCASTELCFEIGFYKLK